MDSLCNFLHLAWARSTIPCRNYFCKCCIQISTKAERQNPPVAYCKMYPARYAWQNSPGKLRQARFAWQILPCTSFVPYQASFRFSWRVRAMFCCSRDSWYSKSLLNMIKWKRKQANLLMSIYLATDIFIFSIALFLMLKKNRHPRRKYNTAMLILLDKKTTLVPRSNGDLDLQSI